MKKVLRGMIYLILFTILIWGFIYLGKKDFSTNISDAELFSKEYKAVSSDNPFVYVTSSDVLDILKNKTGIILVGFQSNAWMQEYVKQLYPILRDNNIKKVYYYDVLEDRKENTEFYQTLVNIMNEQGDDITGYDNDGNARIYVPLVIYVVKGEIVGYDSETSQLSTDDISVEDYWTEDKVQALKDKLSAYSEKVKTVQDENNSQGCDLSCGDKN